MAKKELPMPTHRDLLIAAGVKSLKESYPSINEDNILTDRVYKAFFASSLAETSERLTGPLKSACDALLAEVSKRNP